MLLAAPGWAAEAENEIVASALGTNAAIVLDGELTDEAWQRAEPVSSFVQRDPLEGAPATYRTEARVVFDATAIYVGVRAFDPEPTRILGFLTRREVGSASDWI